MATGGNTRDLAVNMKLNGLIVSIDLRDYGAGTAPSMVSPTSGYGWPHVARIPALPAAPIHRFQTGMIGYVDYHCATLPPGVGAGFARVHPFTRLFLLVRHRLGATPAGRPGLSGAGVLGALQRGAWRATARAHRPGTQGNRCRQGAPDRP